MFPSNSNDQILAWNGTKIENLESIIKYGLKFPGIKLLNVNITPEIKYIPNQRYVLGINNLEKPIFASPFLNCASKYFLFLNFTLNLNYHILNPQFRLESSLDALLNIKLKELIGKVEVHCSLQFIMTSLYIEYHLERISLFNQLILIYRKIIV